MRKCGKPAPHKALLLLSVIDLVERGVINDCRVTLSDALIQQFKSNTTKLLGESILFQPKISYPFFHMRSEPFWELVSPRDGKVEDVPSYSLSTLKQNIAYARIDSELFELMKNDKKGNLLYNTEQQNRSMQMSKGVCLMRCPMSGYTDS